MAQRALVHPRALPELARQDVDRLEERLVEQLAHAQQPRGEVVDDLGADAAGELLLEVDDHHDGDLVRVVHRTLGHGAVRVRARVRRLGRRHQADALVDDRALALGDALRDDDVLLVEPAGELVSFERLDRAHVAEPAALAIGHLLHVGVLYEEEVDGLDEPASEPTRVPLDLQVRESPVGFAAASVAAAVVGSLVVLIAVASLVVALMLLPGVRELHPLDDRRVQQPGEHLRLDVEVAARVRGGEVLHDGRQVRAHLARDSEVELALLGLAQRRRPVHVDVLHALDESPGHGARQARELRGLSRLFLELSRDLCRVLPRRGRVVPRPVGAGSRRHLVRVEPAFLVQHPPPRALAQLVAAVPVVAVGVAAGVVQSGRGRVRAHLPVAAEREAHVEGARAHGLDHVVAAVHVLELEPVHAVCSP